MSLVEIEMPLVVPSDHLRQRENPEIIDVDALDIADIIPTRARPPRQRRRLEDGRSLPIERDTISISDSDDDPDIQFIGSSQRTSPRPRPVRAERIFSPPPPPQMNAIPPVPEIPHRFVRMRRHPPPFPGVVLPDDQPFPFEANMRRQARAPSLPIPPPAAPSHHVPAMGFGGAIIAFARDIMGARRNNGEDDVNPRRRMLNFEPGMFGHWNAFDVFGDRDDHYPNDDVFPFFEDDLDDFARRGRTHLNGLPHRAEPDYKPEYTHSHRPASGFTFNFAASSSDSGLLDLSGSSSSTTPPPDASMTLACARCRDPLILGASDVAEGRNMRKLWGLRCGHLLDGKCIEEIMKPRSLLERLNDPPKVDVKGKGKMKAQDVPRDEQVTTSDSAHIEASSPSAMNPNDNSVRSRLRPRHPLSPASHTQMGASSRPFQRRPMPIPMRSTRPTAKGKSKAKGPIIEAEHEWKCPVSGCERLHSSVFVEGRWIMDTKNGAIAVFV
ncbi:hypothetical protein BJ138DRAFT_1113013 [Hygrophoropsis aurantiaca]|uniref:Uncharacterized protein n=1 Tax=Hygrophoropsis aurantiaca TaxID=72124 RepID=A0ACB8AEP0_9AGAM|nr:hypothetical protein BJ138DRAFT_1113013 [Hygrophoropsis aurantiaca]